MKKFPFLPASILIFLAALASAHAATTWPSDGSRASVQAMMELAAEGDTVTLPAGTFNWTSGVAWTAPANVTLRGAGTSTIGGNDQTIIYDDVADGQPFLRINANSSGVFRMTGLTFAHGTGALKENGSLAIYGPGTIRIDHCHFDATSDAHHIKAILFGGGIRGVMDYCIGDFHALNAFYFYNGRSGEGEGQGNYEWSQPTAFGTSDFFFIEDCIFNGSLPDMGALSSRIWDGYTASKVVVRFNTLYRCGISETHGTGHAPNDRGLRAQEAYGNSITTAYDLVLNEPNRCMIDASNGTALVWGNSSDNVFKQMFLFQVTRASNGTYSQSATPDGWGYAGTISGLPGAGSNWDGGTYNGTDTVYGYPAIDQPGRGQGDLLTGDFPSKVNSVFGTLRWPRQALEPIYIWANIGWVAPGWGDNYYAPDVRVVADQDYYQQASGVQTTSSNPFNGTTGAGWGTLARRPAEPVTTPGVAYWVINEGSWNTSSSNPYGVQQNGADGRLYVADEDGMWQLYYEPYTYPHPLRGETSASQGYTVGKLRMLRR